MRALAANLPRALEDGFRTGRELAPPAREGSSSVVVVGMGGSAIAADLARGIISAESPVAYSVCRSPDLPRSVDRRTHVVLVSYSGNTWETLQAYDAATRAGAHRTVVTSGGALAERATEDGVAVLPVPPGLPPRATVGQLLGGMLGLLDPWFPESNEARVARVAERVSGMVGTFARSRGPAAVLAERVGDRLPFVYAESAFLGLARRWKTQIEENAKRLAVFDEVPELFHNAIVGWDATSRTEAARCAVLLLEWSGEGPLTRKSFRYLESLLRRKSVRVQRVPLAAEDRLEALVAGISLGDYVSLFLADRRGVDPLPVEAIGRLKATLGSPGPRGRN
jgi:glucose/mannose-6-phosphate isomerase